MSMKKVAARKKTVKRKLTVPEIVEWLSVRDILVDVDRVATEHHVTLHELLGSSRAPHIVAARHEAWRRVVEEMGWSYGSTARAFGVHHTSVMSALGGK